MKPLVVPLVLASLALSTARSQTQDREPNQAALDALAARSAAFLDAYHKADPDALADFFLPDGEIVLPDGEVVSGREEIARFYSGVFSDAEKPAIALETDSVRFVAPGIAIEDGSQHVTRPAGDVASHEYTAVLVRQEDGSWLTASVRDEIADHAPAGEKLIALEWLIGDWLIENDGTRTLLTFAWSEDGPYLDGRALTELAGERSVASTYRIGWNNNRGNFVSWAFDAGGGYHKSDWAVTDHGWMLRTAGVTADGEVCLGTGSIERDSSGQGFDWASRDQTIGGVVQPDRRVRVVKRPPEAASTSIGKE